MTAQSSRPEFITNQEDNTLLAAVQATAEVRRMYAVFAPERVQ
jgi:hypothetical protein